MAEEIKINTQLLNKDKENMQMDLNQIQLQLKGMFDEIAELNTMWEGPANTAFNAQFKTDYGTMNSICLSISRYLECMEYAGNEYVKCENSIKASINAIQL